MVNLPIPTFEASPVDAFSSKLLKGNLGDLLRVVVLGAGIQGSAIAAMLAACGFVFVTVLERDRPGCGITSTNHGRAHGARWNYSHNSKSIIERTCQGREMLGMLPNVWEARANGMYCAETAMGAAAFENFFSTRGIEHVRATQVENTASWVDPSRYVCYEIPESSFNPAGVSAGLIQGAEKTGRCELINRGAVRLNTKGDHFLVRLSDGQSVEADVVINALGGWHNTIESDLPLWRPEMMWSCWRLICLDSLHAGLPPLDRVITIDRIKGTSEAQLGPLAAVPHGSHVIFGCDMPALQMSSQDQVRPGDDWRPARLDDPMDRYLLESHAEHFPALKRLLDAGQEHLVTSFPGVYPELKTSAAQARDVAPTPYPNSATWREGAVRGYYPLFGGSATTSLINARDACAYVLEENSLATVDKPEWMQRIVATFPEHIEGRMIWNGR